MESPDGAKLDLVLFCMYVFLFRLLLLLLMTRKHSFLDKDWAIYLDQMCVPIPIR